MALIYCRECGKQISDSAKMCPHCGCSTEYGTLEAQRQGLSVSVIVGCVFALIGIVLFFTALSTMLEGIDDRGTFSKWIAKEDGASGTFIKLCIGLGMSLGGAVALFKAKARANQIADRAYKAAAGYEASSDVPPVQIDYSGSTSGTWTCSCCGRVNANYVSSCACGTSKRGRVR